jgi:putative solute:sodium symporter small subunit
MQNASFHPANWADLAAAALDLEQRLGLRRLKRGMLTMLAAWLAYFVVINMWVRTLNKVIVPLLDVPLGVFLVAQGTAVIFLVAVVLLVRKARGAITA